MSAIAWFSESYYNLHIVILSVTIILGLVWLLYPNKITKLVFLSNLMPIAALLVTRIMFLFINPGYGGHIFFIFNAFIVLIVWGWFLRKKLKTPWKLIPLWLALPIALGTFCVRFVEVIRDIDEPYRMERYSDAHVASSFKNLSDFIFKYKSQCGALPEKLENLLQEKKGCWKEVDFQMISYRDGAALLDPWGRVYQYQVLGKNQIEMKTLGADGKAGGERNDKDHTFRR